MTNNQQYTRSTIKLNTIFEDDAFSFRHHFDTTHVRDLRQVITNNPRKQLSPLLVWLTPDGQYTLIDGHYRSAAYYAAGQAERRVHVRVFHGTRDEALLLALSSNSKATLPLSNMERQDGAWRLVCSSGATAPYVFTKAQIVDAAGVSERQVSYMRKRFQAVATNGPEAISALTGRWFKDRNTGTSEEAYSPISDKERDRGIDTLTQQVRDLLDRRKGGAMNPILADQDAVFTALYNACGNRFWKGFFEYALMDEEEADDWGEDVFMGSSPNNPTEDDEDEDEDEPNF